MANNEKLDATETGRPVAEKRNENRTNKKNSDPAIVYNIDDENSKKGGDPRKGVRERVYGIGKSATVSSKRARKTPEKGRGGGGAGPLEAFEGGGRKSLKETSDSVEGSSREYWNSTREGTEEGHGR